MALTWGIMEGLKAFERRRIDMMDGVMTRGKRGGGKWSGEE